MRAFYRFPSLASLAYTANSRVMLTNNFKQVFGQIFCQQIWQNIRFEAFKIYMWSTIPKAKSIFLENNKTIKLRRFLVVRQNNVCNTMKKRQFYFSQEVRGLQRLASAIKMLWRDFSSKGKLNLFAEATSKGP